MPDSDESGLDGCGPSGHEDEQGDGRSGGQPEVHVDPFRSFPGGLTPTRG